MTVRTFTISDVPLDPAPGQIGDVRLGNLIDQRHGGAITVGYSRYAPDQTLHATLTHDEASVVLEGRLSVTGAGGTQTVGVGGVIYMEKGDTITLRSHEEGAVIAYVTHPHWQETL